MEAGVGTEVGIVLKTILLVVADGIGEGVVVDGTHVEVHGDGGIAATGGRNYHNGRASENCI